MSMSMPRRGRRLFPVIVLLWLIGLMSSSLDAAPANRHTVAELAARADRIDAGFALHGLTRPAGGDTWLQLTPQPIFAPGAVVVLVGENGTSSQAPPPIRHFHGHERDDPAALAFVSVHPDGRIRGWLRRGGQLEAFSREPGSDSLSLPLHRVDLIRDGELTRGFSCGSDTLPTFAPGPSTHVSGAALAHPGPAPAHERIGSTEHWANVAIDTDFAYYANFNDTNAAANYAIDLIGFSSLLYRNEVDTGLLIPYLRLFTTPDDPWQQSSQTSCMLYEFGRHWHHLQGDVERTIAHFLSGKTLNGGIAWLGVLCNGNQPRDIGDECPGLPAVDYYVGGYGVSTSIVGNFNPANPQSVWDLIVVAHEIGHNFDSPHTHCYGGIGGNPNPVDQCFVEQTPGLQCHSGPTSLPGPTGQGSGTIMSYCHQLPGNLSNIGLSFGSNHPYGIQPVRVPHRMHAHVQQRAAQFPACFSAPGPIFENGFECTPDMPGCGGGAPVCLSSNGATANGGWFSGDANNRVRNLAIGAGNQLTGIAIDVRVQALAPSWLDEARIMFSSSDPNMAAVQYTPGLGQETPGTIDHSSDGVIDFASNNIQPVTVGSDGILRVEWFETYDDPQVNPDSLWSNHPAPSVCPGIRLVCSNQAACDAAAQGAP